MRTTTLVGLLLASGSALGQQLQMGASQLAMLLESLL